ncbi:MAG: MucBP domain-containing protein [Clostridia bacterium]|nr:MucBP domain-containing protein [Clostridia bacterium]
MRKSKIIISVILIITILGIHLESLAASFNLNVLFDGKNISMESETPDMSWNLENFLPGDSDTSSITIHNGGKKTAKVETTISIEEDNRLLEMIDLKVTNKTGETVFTGKYTELKTIEKSLKPGESETYTAVTSLNVNAGNEYQDKQYKLKFNFKAIGEIPYGTLTVKYVDENGDDLEKPTVETKKVTSEKYNLPETGKSFDGYRFKSVEGELKGEYKEEGTTVIYHYNKIRYGNLIVKYVDEEGNILEQKQETKETGTEYKLDPTGKTIEGYRFENVEGKIAGNYIEGDTIVTYHYKKIKYGNLIVKYVDEEGNILQQKQETKETGTKYSLESVGKEIPGYMFERVEGELKGEYKVEDTIVTYIYNKIPEIKIGKLIIKYVDQDGKLLQEETETKQIGTAYNLSSIGKDIPGYDFVTVEGDCIGEYKETDTIVIYKYKKRENGKVIVRYVDENEKILQEDITTGIVDKPYSYTEEEVKKDIPGYEFKKIDGELTGEYKEKDTIIFCRYEKIKHGRLIVVCIDENNEVIKRTITTEKVGTDYNLGKVGEEIEGYTFLGIEGEPEGKYKVEDTIVTYRYQKNKPQGPSTEEVTLPKTGQFIYIYIILGVVILGLFFLWILAKKKKKEKQENNVENKK